MRLDINEGLENIKEGLEKTKTTVHENVNEFHEQYVSNVIPDCGKYGDAARFAAEIVPGVSEYNAIREGDWKAFAIAAGIDIAAIGVGAFTAGAGYAAVKSGTSAAKIGVKVAAKEIAEEVAEKTVKEVAEELVEKSVKETVEETAEKLAKETVEESIEKSGKEAAEEIAKKEMIDKKATVVKQNYLKGKSREAKEDIILKLKNGKDNVIQQVYLRDSNGNILKDSITNEGRILDFAVKKDGIISEIVEITSKTADKTAQTAKETRILEMAKEIGGAYIKDHNTGELIKLSDDVIRTIRRFK